MASKSADDLRLLILGATGVVGREALARALAEPRIATIFAPSRQPLPPHPKLRNPIVDFSRIDPDAPWFKVEAVVCALGTTIKTAGSQAAFAAIDRDLPLKCAGFARACGATRFALTSSVGASPHGGFYLRTKAEVEAGLRALGFESLTIVRPSLIDARRSERRPAEGFAMPVARWLSPVIPKRYRMVRPAAIARALIEGVLRDGGGEQIVESEMLQDVRGA
jgi:uncharacterized protein YbjT (DUF2867 family)